MPVDPVEATLADMGEEVPPGLRFEPHARPTQSEVDVELVAVELDRSDGAPAVLVCRVSHTVQW